MELTTSLFVAVLFLALSCQYMSVSIGLGYGTTLTPLLLMLGFSPLQVIPAILLSQLIGGTIAGLAHQQFGNIKLDFSRDNKLIKGRLRRLGYLPSSFDSKVVFVLALSGMIGVLVGTFTAVHIPQIVLETYIGAMVLGIGLTIILKRRHAGAFSWRGLITFGLIGAFNKGVSGGGYVPLVTGGQIISGRETRSSVGTTTIAVTIVCAVGLLSHFLLKGDIYWMLAVATSIGSIVAAPFAALIVRKVNTEKLRFTIGLATIVLGISTLAMTFML